MGKIRAWFLLSLSGYAGLAYATQRADTGLVLGAFAVLFAGYGWVLHTVPTEEKRWRLLLFATIAFRLLWLLATPALSDDYFRFLWDGRLLASGQNPYLILPSQHPDWPLFAQLNSPNYYTVYPPAHQFLTALGPWLFPDSFFGQILTLRILIWSAEAGTVWLMFRLLQRYELPRERIFLYALNPLVIVELSGNLHLEGVMLGLLLLAVFLSPKTRRWSALSWGAAISVKVVPLLALPLLWRRLGWGKSLWFGAVVVGLNALLFAPFFSLELVRNVASSLGLYFQKFEFNASVYYLVRAIGFWLEGYNIIQFAGPGLALVALALMGLVVFWDWKGGVLQSKNPDFWQRVLFLHAVYLFCATTVHPWYLVSLVGYSVFTRFRFAVVWSGLVVLSYAAYGRAGFSENYGLLGLEYAGVYGWLGLELAGFFRIKFPSKSTAS